MIFHLKYKGNPAPEPAGNNTSRSEVLTEPAALIGKVFIMDNPSITTNLV